eukprot:5842558-Pyramimonas_sp.AAC.2
MHGGGANHITEEGIFLPEEPVPRASAWRGSQSHPRGGNMPVGGANHIAWEGISLPEEPAPGLPGLVRLLRVRHPRGVHTLHSPHRGGGGDALLDHHLRAHRHRIP